MWIKITAGIAAVLLTIITMQWLNIKKLNAELTVARAKIIVLEAANIEDLKTIEALKSERTKANNLCQSRLEGYDATLAELQRIDGLKGGVTYVGPAESVQPGHQRQNPSSASDDSIASTLNGMWALPVLPTSDESGVREGESGTNAQRKELLPGQLGYCLDEVNAKNLLRNIVLMRSWALDMKKILDAHQ